MAKPLEIKVQESVEELQKYLRKSSCDTIRKRIKMLIAIKKREPESLSLKALAKICKYNPNSISVWRKMYLTDGIEAIMQHNWTGTESKHISKEQYDYLSEKLNNPTNGLVGYKELLNWVETEFDISMKYTTLYEYVKRNFKTKIKVARKSHIKKDEDALIAFKKNS
jgi:transposase